MAWLFELFEEPDSSNLSWLGKEQCVVDVDTEIRDGALDLTMAEQDLD
jgi:hypothetical protein